MKELTGRIDNWRFTANALAVVRMQTLNEHARHPRPTARTPPAPPRLNRTPPQLGGERARGGGILARTAEQNRGYYEQASRHVRRGRAPPPDVGDGVHRHKENELSLLQTMPLYVASEALKNKVCNKVAKLIEEEREKAKKGKGNFMLGALVDLEDVHRREEISPPPGSPLSPSSPCLSGLQSVNLPGSPLSSSSSTPSLGMVDTPMPMALQQAMPVIHIPPDMLECNEMLSDGEVSSFEELTQEEWDDHLKDVNGRDSWGGEEGEGEGREKDVSNLPSGRRPSGRRTSSRFKGVCFVRGKGVWKAQVRHKGKTINLGRFEKEEEAANAYDSFVIVHRGGDVPVNFSSRDDLDWLSGVSVEELKQNDVPVLVEMLRGYERGYNHTVSKLDRTRIAQRIHAYVKSPGSCHIKKGPPSNKDRRRGKKKKTSTYRPAYRLVF